jgi:hypothetical protein
VRRVHVDRIVQRESYTVVHRSICRCVVYRNGRVGEPGNELGEPAYTECLTEWGAECVGVPARDECLIDTWGLASRCTKRTRIQGRI